MRILLVATSYPRDGRDWKGRFIYDQAAALARCGASVSLWAPPGELPSGVKNALQRDDASWLKEILDQGGIAHLLRQRPLAGAMAGMQLLCRLRHASRLANVDLYLVNWLQNALALPNDGRPAIITVLGSDFRLLNLPTMQSALRRQFKRRMTWIAPNADWMAPKLKKLFGDIACVTTNPFGVAPEWFDVQQANDRDGWIVVSRVTRDKLGDLLEWGNGLFSVNSPLHLLGPMQETVNLPIWVHHHGATNPSELRERWFLRSRGLLTLSRHAEGRPQVLIEAMAAGLPVIASNISAHADLIADGKTGWLVGDRTSLVAAMQAAESPDVAPAVGAAARAFVAEKIGTWDDCARRYIAGGQGLLATTT